MTVHSDHGMPKISQKSKNKQTKNLYDLWVIVLFIIKLHLCRRSHQARFHILIKKCQFNIVDAIMNFS